MYVLEDAHAFVRLCIRRPKARMCVPEDARARTRRCVHTPDDACGAAETPNTCAFLKTRPLARRRACMHSKMRVSEDDTPARSQRLNYMRPKTCMFLDENALV